MTRSWRIRAAGASDAAAIAELIRLAFPTQSRPTQPPPSALKETVASVSAHLDDGGGAVVDDGGAIVGAVLWSEEGGGLYIGRLSVHPDYRRRGIASALMRDAEREARRQGLPRLWLGAGKRASESSDGQPRLTIVWSRVYGSRAPIQGGLATWTSPVSTAQ